ncbi:uncharacterized protein VTP21DRAFT_6425 [Calcarisporiella thermophila]|uniref:uncharacterized protein n=1 Tax=Calcarisporiella thermophila TaxID=911321 RepID=UPI0037431C77
MTAHLSGKSPTSSSPQARPRPLTHKMPDEQDLFGSDDSDYAGCPDDDPAAFPPSPRCPPAASLSLPPTRAIPGLTLSELPAELAEALLSSLVGAQVLHPPHNNQAMLFGLPHWLKWIEDWVRDQGIFSPEVRARPTLFDQAIINFYNPGEGIVPHVDLPRFDDGIVIISLLSSCFMVLTPVSSAAAALVPVLLRPGSVLALEGEARYAWKHGIEERELDVWGDERIRRDYRISVTLRKLLDGGEACPEQKVIMGKRE